MISNLALFLILRREEGGGRREEGGGRREEGGGRREEGGGRREESNYHKYLYGMR